MKLLTPFIGTTLAFALLGNAALAAGEVENMAEWDSDSNGELTQDEWVTSFEEFGYFDKIDENENGVLNIDEVDQALISDYEMQWDIDDGGLVEQEEALIALFNAYDENDDAIMDEREFDDFAQRLSEADLTRSNLDA